jgi:DNA-binding GntR family transcriptional regulator
VAVNEHEGVQRLKIGDAVVRAMVEIRYRIVSGVLAAGEQLRQEEMARELEISRAPIREALRALADQGLLEHRVHSGYFVKKRAAGELRQIYQILEFLEGLVMADLPPATPQVLERLRSVNDEMRRYVRADDWAPMVDLNRRFHFEIFRLSPHTVVLEELERLWTIAAPYIAQKYTTEMMREQTVEEHDGLIEALESGDGALVNELLAEHRSQRRPMYQPAEQFSLGPRERRC